MASALALYGHWKSANSTIVTSASGLPEAGSAGPTGMGPDASPMPRSPAADGASAATLATGTAGASATAGAAAGGGEAAQARKSRQSSGRASACGFDIRAAYARRGLRGG